MYDKPDFYPPQNHNHWVVKEVTIDPTDWVMNGETPYVQIADPNIDASEDQIVRISLADSANKDERLVTARAKLFGFNKAPGHFDVLCDGAKPKIPIKIMLEIEVRIADY